MALRGLVWLSLLSGVMAASLDVTPIEKVIELIEGLKTDVEEDGAAEAASYDEFACFCKKETETKSTSVKDGHDQIDKLSASIADKTAARNDDMAELAKRKKKQEEMKAELADNQARHAKEKAEYEVEEADLAKAIQSLKDAIKAMSDSKPSAASLLAVRKNIGETLEMAEAMSLLKTAKHKSVAAFLQNSAGVDPSDPEYKFHSDDIIAVCEDLLKDYTANKKELDDEWSKTDKAYKEKIAALEKSIEENSDAMKKLKENIDKLAEEIAGHREDLVMAKGQMEDDELYLKDLTARCEERSHDWDQRSAMRADELGALNQALDVLKNSVKERADEVNVRAALVQKLRKESAAAAVSVKSQPPKATQKAISFLQGASVNADGREAIKEKALDVLRQEGKRLGSVALLSLAERVRADPFIKIKKLIQALIERLLTEAKNEATKKGFCDTELGKAEKDRDYRYEEATKLSAELAGLEAKRDELEAEIKQLNSDIKDETKALKETTKDRKEEKEDNLKTLKTAKEGLEAVKDALKILKSFYKEAAKAAGPGGYVAFLDASPVDEDTQGAGFKGNYAGKQGGMKAVFALLETLASDFDRTLRKTEEAENRAHRDFVDYDQTAKSSIAGKTTKEELDQQDLKTTKTKIATAMEDMQTAVDLLDSALKMLEELKPTCIDTGMSYKERVEKREEEIAALKKALEILAPPGL